MAKTTHRLSLTGRASLPIQAAEGTEGSDGTGAPKVRRFEIVAYTGEPLVQYSWDYPVVVDMAGIDVGSGRLPILEDHKPERGAVVGQSDMAAVEGGQLVLRGRMFSEEEAAQDIIRLADQGFAWSASIGANAIKRQFVAEGATVEANGRTYPGPLYLATQTAIRECSFVVIGADKHASALVAHQRPAPAGKRHVAARQPAAAPDDPVREALARESRRCARITALCYHAGDPTIDLQARDGSVRRVHLVDALITDGSSVRTAREIITGAALQAGGDLPPGCHLGLFHED